MLKAGTCLETKIIHRIRMLNLSLKELELQEKKIEVLKNIKACLWINYEKYLTNQNQ